MATALSNVLPFPSDRSQARPNPNDPATQQATGIVTTEARPGEAHLCTWVNALYYDAQQARDRLTAGRLWDVWEQGYWGQHWPSALPSYKTPIVINELKRLILQEMSDLTDLMPTVYVTADPRTGKRDLQVEYALQAYWVSQFVDMTLLEVATDASVWPAGFFEVIWDPLKDYGQGNVLVRPRHPATVFPDPYASDDIDWRYVILRDVMDVHEVRRRWPDQGKRVRPDAARPAESGPITGLAGTASGRGGQMATPMYPTAAPVPTHGQDNRVAVLTCYAEDATTELVPGVWKGVDGAQHLRRLVRHKYPAGRLTIATQDVILYDGPNPYRDGFPLVRLILQPSLHRFWPQSSLVGDQLEVQRAADKLESLAVENALRLQKAVILADANSGIDPRTFGDIPGQIVMKTPGSQVEFVRPPPLPPDLIQAGARLRQEMARQMGHAGARQGQAQPGNRSADLTETEISQGMGLTRLRGRFQQMSTIRLVQKIFATMADFYTTPRLIPYFVEDKWAPAVWHPLLQRESYAVHVDPNSFSIQSKSMVKRLAVALRKLGVMPVEDLYRILEFPQGTEIAKRQKQEMQLAAQAQAQKGGRRR